MNSKRHQEQKHIQPRCPSTSNSKKAATPRPRRVADTVAIVVVVEQHVNVVVVVVMVVLTVAVVLWWRSSSWSEEPYGVVRAAAVAAAAVASSSSSSEVVVVVVAAAATTTANYKTAAADTVKCCRCPGESKCRRRLPAASIIICMRSANMFQFGLASYVTQPTSSDDRNRSRLIRRHFSSDVRSVWGWGLCLGNVEGCERSHSPACWSLRATRLTCTNGSERSNRSKGPLVIMGPTDLHNGLLASSQLLALLPFGLLPSSNESVAQDSTHPLQEQCSEAHRCTSVPCSDTMILNQTLSHTEWAIWLGRWFKIPIGRWL